MTQSVGHKGRCGIPIYSYSKNGVYLRMCIAQVGGNAVRINTAISPVLSTPSHTSPFISFTRSPIVLFFNVIHRCKHYTIVLFFNVIHRCKHWTIL